MGTETTGTFVEQDSFNYNEMSMMGATKISKRNQAQSRQSRKVEKERLDQQSKQTQCCAGGNACALF